MKCLEKMFRYKLVRHLTVLLIIKLALLMVIKHQFFSEPAINNDSPAQQQVAAHLMSEKNTE
jgi:hypothetical protein